MTNNNPARRALNIDASEHALSLAQQILLATDGTVTDLIALLTGETINVTKIAQTVTRRIAPSELRCAGEAALLCRKILLRGASKNYLYADSIFVFERLSTSIQNQLLETDRPIGLMWKEERLEMFREIVDRRIEPCAEIARYFDLPVTSLFVSRTYLIHQAGQPLGSITEKWPLSCFRD